MGKIRLDNEAGVPTPPATGELILYPRGGQFFYMSDDAVEKLIEPPADAVAAHAGQADPHPQYLTPTEADLEYADIAHVHATGNLLVVSKTPGPNEYSTVAAALAAASALVPSATNRFVIRVLPGEYTEAAGLTIPAYIYISGLDPWNASVLKTADLTQDFITVSPNGGLFNVAVSGPTTAGKSAIKQVASGTIKIYWVNIKEGSYGITLAPVSGVARCHCIGVVTDGPTQMNRLFNCDNPAGAGVFILMQSGPMSGSWVGVNAAAVYLNGDGVSASPKASATIDLCQFRSSGVSGQVYSDVYADNGSLVRGICVSHAGGSLTNTKYAINVGPNNGAGYKTMVAVHASQIKPGFYTKDIKIQNNTSNVSYSGTATEANLDFVAGATFNGVFADSTLGQVIYGELYVGNTTVKTPLTAYIEADKNTGLVSGGGLSRGAGARQVDVAAGAAFIDTASGFKRVSWNAQTVTVAANKPKVRIYVDNTGTLQQSDAGINKTLNVQLGEVSTDADSVIFIFDQGVHLPQFRPALYEYLEKVIGPINVSGGVVTLSATAKKLDVTNSEFYLTEDPLLTVGGTAITFTYWYRDGVGGWTAVEGQDTVDTGFYDNGSGTLAALPAGKFKRDLLLAGVSADGTDYHLFYGQTLFDTSIDATSNPNINDVIQEHACRLSAIVVQQGGAAIDRLEDQRPRIGQQASASASITAHNDLSGRDSSTAHTQYQLTTAKGAANGYPSLDGDTKIPVGQLPTVTDYTHGDKGGGTLHAVATAGAAGFMSSGDKSKLDGIQANATANSSDATLLARGNHTGEQSIATVTGLQTELNSKITGSRQQVVKAADQAGIASTTLIDVTSMNVALEANSTYRFRYDIIYQSTLGANGIGFAVDGPSAPTALAYRKTIPTNATAVVVQSASAYNTLQTSATTPAAAEDTFATMEGIITTGVTPGNLVMRVASETGTQSVTVRAGTVVEVEKIA